MGGAFPSHRDYCTYTLSCLKYDQEQSEHINLRLISSCFQLCKRSTVRHTYDDLYRDMNQLKQPHCVCGNTDKDEETQPAGTCAHQDALCPEAWGQEGSLLWGQVSVPIMTPHGERGGAALIKQHYYLTGRQKHMPSCNHTPKRSSSFTGATSRASARLTDRRFLPDL